VALNLLKGLPILDFVLLEIFKESMFLLERQCDIQREVSSVKIRSDYNERNLEPGLAGGG